VYGASEGSFHPGFYPEPIAASEEYIENYKKEWLKAVERCKEIGFDYIEIHGAHGYLIHGQ
jgi:2,4-dienoyl-CoA reductase-like NADH-dependent reductase (Old Yellow Enzyme family)